jgi:hypothetical protein
VLGTATSAAVLTIRSPYSVISSSPVTPMAASSRRRGAEARPGTGRASCPIMAAAPLM